VTTKPEKSDHQKDLEWIRDEALKSMATCDSDQNFVMLGKLVIEAWREINVISGSQTGAPGGQSTAPKGETLSEFQRRLAEKRRKTS
jgi:hypothetical protein